MDTKPYVEYLDKEMTIMGILSAVSLAAPAGILSTMLSDHSELKALVWNPGQAFIIVGSVLCVIGALAFYKERSLLAWYYGQICLTAVLSDKKYISSKLRELLDGADSWETWWPYNWGFTFLLGGFAEYLFALFFSLVPPRWNWLLANIYIVKVSAFCACPAAVAIIAALQRHVLTNYKFSEDYWEDFRTDIFGNSPKGRSLPHDNVFTRLKQSPIHGVGVFAIEDIPEGTYVFEPDDDPLQSVHVDVVKSLPLTFRRLYEDFCVLQGDTYQCPSSFNRLTPAWYLNTSKNPNVAADSSLKFRAIRNIRTGEELTADYEAYSDRQPSSEIP